MGDETPGSALTPAGGERCLWTKALRWEHIEVSLSSVWAITSDKMDEM